MHMPSDDAARIEAPPTELSATADADIERQMSEALAGLDMNQIAQMPTPAESQQGYEPGAILSGTVVMTTEKDILLDLGGKVQGVVPRDEFPSEWAPPPGAAMTVMVDSVDAEAGLLKLSKKRADVAVLWRDIKVGDVVEGVVSGMNKGGLELAIRGMIRAFIPASQVDMRFLKDISELFGQTVRCEVTKVDRDSENLVVSRRKVLEREAATAKDHMLESLQEGEVRRGRVRNLAEYGAFIDLGGIDGLLHVSDMSYGRVDKPSDVLNAGDEVDVKILKVDRNKGKVSLGLKQTLPNPWETVAQRYSPNMVVKGRVMRHADFGAFVEIEAGIEGLIALGELSWSRRVRHPREIVREGDVVDVMVLSVDPEKKRISLSIKQIGEDPWANAHEKYAPGRKFNVKVLRLTEFGAFVEVYPGVEAMIHISELSPQRVKAVSDVLKVGQEVEARVLRVDPENRKIGMSLKPEPVFVAEPEPVAADAKKPPKKPSKPRRGGIDFSWDEPLVKLDPTKFARG